jgi:branched-subunit amino acid transport protein AzlD
MPKRALQLRSLVTLYSTIAVSQFFTRLLPFVLFTHNKMSHKSQQCHNTTYKRFSADILLLRKNIDIIVVAGYLIERL